MHAGWVQNKAHETSTSERMISGVEYGMGIMVMFPGSSLSIFSVHVVFYHFLKVQLKDCVIAVDIVVSPDRYVEIIKGLVAQVLNVFFGLPLVDSVNDATDPILVV